MWYFKHTLHIIIVHKPGEEPYGGEQHFFFFNIFTLKADQTMCSTLTGDTKALDLIWGLQQEANKRFKL